MFYFASTPMILKAQTQFPVQNKWLKITSVIVTLAPVGATSQVWLSVDVFLIR